MSQVLFPNQSSMATRGQWEEYKNHGRKWKFLGNLKVGAGKEITRKKKTKFLKAMGKARMRG